MPKWVCGVGKAHVIVCTRRSLGASRACFLAPDKRLAIVDQWKNVVVGMWVKPAGWVTLGIACTRAG